MFSQSLTKVTDNIQLVQSIFNSHLFTLIHLAICGLGIFDFIAKMTKSHGGTSEIVRRKKK